MSQIVAHHSAKSSSTIRFTTDPSERLFRAHDDNDNAPTSLYESSKACRLMEGGSGALNSLGGVERDGQDACDAGGARDRRSYAENDGREQFSNLPRRSSSASPTSPSTYGPLVSAMLLSLLPLPAAAYPRSESRIIRRDRRRSGGAADRAISKAIVERPTGNEGWEKRRRIRTGEGDREAVVSVFAKNSQVRMPLLKIAAIVLYFNSNLPIQRRRLSIDGQTLRQPQLRRHHSRSRSP